MIKTNFKLFNKLPPSNRAMIYMMWVFNTGAMIVTIFVNIYVYQKGGAILDVILFNLITYIFNILAFSGIGYLIGKYQQNIKYLYYFSYIMFIIAFISILFIPGFLGVYIFAGLFGLGKGSFRCSVHSQELSNIKDKDRDIYSSMISSGSTFIKVFFPLIIAFIFFIVNKFFNFDPYIVIFSLLPLLYFSTIPIIKNIGDYIPKKIKKKDVKNFLNIKKYGFGLLYMFLIGFNQAIYVILMPIIAIILLKNQVNIGIFEGIIGILSTLSIIFLSTKRSIGNRGKFMLIIASLMSLNILIFVFNFGLMGYIIYSLMMIMLFPLYRITEHVFDLSLMDSIKVEGSDFFPAMILRDLVLFTGKMSSLIIIFLLTYFGIELMLLIKIGLVMGAFVYIIASLSIIQYNKKGINLIH